MGEIRFTLVQPFAQGKTHESSYGDHNHSQFEVPDLIQGEAQWPDHYGRDLALFYADHDMKPQLALQIAEYEYEVRRDVYTADAVAWTALKAGNLDLAKQAIALALRLGTPDPRLFYHAAMIARASGNTALAKEHLERVQALNLEFDPHHGPTARKLLAQLTAQP